MTHFNPVPAATMLADAWRSGSLLHELPTEIRPRTVTEGYDVQDELIALLEQPVVGWKLGAGSAKLKAQSGVGRSLAGRVLGSRRYEPGATVVMPNAAPVTVEFEIAFVLGADVAPGSDGPPDQWIAETRVTFELVLSRFVDRRAAGWPSFAADNSGFQALIVGPKTTAASLPALLASLVVSVDGRERARAASGEDVTDPLIAFADLIAIARERGITLPAGRIVSTGSASLPFAMTESAAEVTASFLGEELCFRTEVAPGAALQT